MAGTQMSFDVFLDHIVACETRASGLTVDHTWWALLIPTVGPVEYSTWSICHVHNGYYKQHRYFYSAKWEDKTDWLSASLVWRMGKMSGAVVARSIACSKVPNGDEIPTTQSC